MKKTVFFILMLLSFFGYSQSQSGCDKILSQEIKLDFANKDAIYKLNKTISKLQDCGLETIDVGIFAKGPILATLLIQLTNEKGGKVTYQNLLDKIKKFTKTPEYINSIERVKIVTELFERKAVVKNWENDKVLFEKLNTPIDIIKKMHLRVQRNTNPNKTYRDLFRDYENENSININRIGRTKKEYDGIFKNAGNVNYDDLLNRAIKLKKPLLLYFTGYACANCRKMEQNVLSDRSIEKRLKNDFYFVNLYVDDRKILPDNERKKSIINGKIIKYIGQKHSELQIRKFKNKYQPYFVLIDKNGIKINDQGYTKDIELFAEFLNSVE